MEKKECGGVVMRHDGELRGEKLEKLEARGS